MSTTITRPDGLTDEEGIAMDALGAAVAAFAALRREHPDELRDFVDGIHKCQDQLAVRVCRRAFPAGWPRKPPSAPTYIVAAGHDQAWVAANRLGLNYRDHTQVRVLDTTVPATGMPGSLLEEQLHYAEGASAGRYWHQVDAAVQRAIAKVG
jgi:hypothetical protein